MRRNAQLRNCFKLTNNNLAILEGTELEEPPYLEGPQSNKYNKQYPPPPGGCTSGRGI